MHTQIYTYLHILGADTWRGPPKKEQPLKIMKFRSLVLHSRPRQRCVCRADPWRLASHLAAAVAEYRHTAMMINSYSFSICKKPSVGHLCMDVFRREATDIRAIKRADSGINYCLMVDGCQSLLG